MLLNGLMGKNFLSFEGFSFIKSALEDKRNRGSLGITFIKLSHDTRTCHCCNQTIKSFIHLLSINGDITINITCGIQDFNIACMT